jgi:hypothetical protein
MISPFCCPVLYRRIVKPCLIGLFIGDHREGPVALPEQSRVRLERRHRVEEGALHLPALANAGWLCINVALPCSIDHAAVARRWRRNSPFGRRCQGRCVLFALEPAYLASQARDVPLAGPSGYYPVTLQNKPSSALAVHVCVS